MGDMRTDIKATGAFESHLKKKKRECGHNKDAFMELSSFQDFLN